MATLNEEFFQELNASATWSTGVSFKRTNPLPLDQSSVFESRELAEAYALSNPVAYPGQIIAVLEDNSQMNIYVLTQIEQVENDVAVYSLGLRDIGASVDLSDYSTTEQVNEAIENAISQIELPQDVDTQTKLISGDNYIDVSGDFVAGAENVYTLKINTETLKSLIGAETTSAMEFKGATATLPILADKGDIYKTIDNIMVPAENDAEGLGFTTSIGDSIVCEGNDKWYLIPSGDDIEDTWRPVNGVANTSTLTFKADSLLSVGIAENGEIVYSHSSIAAPAEEADQTGSRKYITGVKTDGFGHIITIKTATETVENINDIYNAGYGIEITDDIDNDTNHTVNIKLKNEEQNLSLTKSGLATTFNLDDYTTKAEATANGGIRYINQSEIDKLSKLTLDGEDVTISGSVEASQVKNLYKVIENIVTGTSITEDLDSETEGVQLAFGIEKGAEVNVINDYSSDFSLSSTRVLSLNDIPQSKVIGLTDTLTSLDSKVQSLDAIVNGYIDENGTTVSGMASKLEDLITSLPNTYVTVADFNTVVGNLEEMKINNINIMSDLTAIKDILEWKTIDDKEENE